MPHNLYGIDILLDENGQAALAANGQLVLTTGPMAALQDIGLRLEMALGSLFYDIEFGSELYKFKYEENRPAVRAALVREISRRIEMDDRVKWASASVEVLNWDAREINLSAQFELKDASEPSRLVINIGDDIEVIIKDVHPN